MGHHGVDGALVLEQDERRLVGPRPKACVRQPIGIGPGEVCVDDSRWHRLERAWFEGCCNLRWQTDRQEFVGEVANAQVRANQRIMDLRSCTPLPSLPHAGAIGKSRAEHAPAGLGWNWCAFDAMDLADRRDSTLPQGDCMRDCSGE